MPESLPIFPLSRAIVPGVMLKLQIFEQRYLKLVRNAMATGQGFGVCGLISGAEVGQEASFHNLGCLLRIEDWDSLPSGLLGISVRGTDRFRVVNEPDQNPDGLWLAEVEWLTDERELETPPEYSGLVQLGSAVAEQMGESRKGANLGDAAQLGWVLASALPLDNAQFAALLGENDPAERLELLADYVDELSRQ